MQDFLIYSAKVAVTLAVFYLFFRLLLSRETFHRLNRIVLLGGLVASFLLPLCVITVRIPTVAKNVVVRAVRMPGTGVEWWIIALSIFYFLGAFIALVRLVIAFGHVKKMVHEGEKHSRPDGNVVVVLDTPDGRDDPSPSSWMAYIFLGRKDFQSAEKVGFENSPVYIHEAAHLELHHSVDLLFLDLCALLQWFNPAIWLLRRELTALHEYEADKAVLDKGFQPREYQLLLVRKALSDAGYSVANNLNHSALKGRIDMMLRQPSKAGRAFKLLVLLPLLGVGLVLNARRVFMPKENNMVIVGNDENVIYRVEGMEFDKNRMNEIDPNTIKSIDVRKDGKGGGIIDIYLK